MGSNNSRMLRLRLAHVNFNLIPINLNGTTLINATESTYDNKQFHNQIEIETENLPMKEWHTRKSILVHAFLVQL